MGRGGVDQSPGIVVDMLGCVWGGMCVFSASVDVCVWALRWGGRGGHAV